MSLRTKSASFIVLVLLSVTAIAVSAVAHWRQSPIEARPKVVVELVGVASRGDAEVSLDKAGEVKTGETLRWTINSYNESDAAAKGYKVIGEIPPGTVFVAGSAAAERTALVTYSIDGGKTYSARPTIEEKQPDGSIKVVPAPIVLYTQIKYEWSDPLDPASRVAAFYAVQVK